MGLGARLDSVVSGGTSVVFVCCAAILWAGVVVGLPISVLFLVILVAAVLWCGVKRSRSICAVCSGDGVALLFGTLSGVFQSQV